MILLYSPKSDLIFFGVSLSIWIPQYIFEFMSHVENITNYTVTVASGERSFSKL